MTEKSKTRFNELGLDEKVQKALAENGLESPFPIQEAAIPLILRGKDVIGQAQTGTGKTAAFSLPLLTKVRSDSRQIQALVLVPTRELAMQVTNEIERFARYTGTRAVSIYGGQSFGLQCDRLRKGAQIVVATPGRLIDHIKRGTIRLDSARFVVLDEADRMLDMGFIDDIRYILSRTNRGGRQTMLFSATMPQEILRLAKEHMRQSETHEVRLNRHEVTADNIDQSYLLVEEPQKLGQLVSMIGRHREQQIIVFAATKRRTDKLASNLRGAGFKASAIHGDLSQKERDSVMDRFRKGANSVLVATDIASRGIDVPAVSHVINYDVPGEPDTYFHRIGRTARAGGSGTAVTLVPPDRFRDFERILAQTKLPIRRLNESMGIALPQVQQGSRRKGPAFKGRNANGRHFRKQWR